MITVKLLNGDLIVLDDAVDADDMKGRLSQLLKVKSNRLKLTKMGDDFYSVFIQPEVHPYASEFQTFCGNFTRFLRDEIFDYLDLDNCSNGLILLPTKTFRSGWDKYFDQFPKFFDTVDRFDRFDGASVIYYDSDADPVNALEVFIAAIAYNEDRMSSNWYSRKYLPFLLPAFSVEQIQQYRSEIWQNAVRQAGIFSSLNDMVVMSKVSLICGLTEYMHEHGCQDDPFPELDQAPDLFPDANAFMNRVSQENELGWDEESMAAVLRYFLKPLTL